MGTKIIFLVHFFSKVPIWSPFLLQKVPNWSPFRSKLGPHLEKIGSPFHVGAVLTCSPTIRQLGNLAAERKRQNQRQCKAKTHRAERKRTIESNFSLWLNWAASPDSLVHTWTLSGSNWAFAFIAFFRAFRV